jgi:type II secretory pathway component HofQ
LKSAAWAGEAGRPANKLSSNALMDTDIRNVLSDISAQAGVTIIADESVRGHVNAELKNVPLEKALEIVLAAGGYVVSKKEDYYLVGSAQPQTPTFAALSEVRIVKLARRPPSRRRSCPPRRSGPM